MRTIFLLLICKLWVFTCSAQTGVLMNKFYITGSLSVGKEDRVFADTSAWLELGKDTSKKGMLLPRVLIDSINTAKRGLFVYSLRDSVLYHFDGTRRVRYVTYKDSSFIQQLVLKYVPYSSGYGLQQDSFEFFVDTTLIASKAYVDNENANDVEYADTAAMLLPYLRKADTANLSNRINQKASYSDSAGFLPTKTFLSSNYFKNGGNAFGGTATLGTTDNNPVDIYANNTRALRIFANGNHLFGTGTTDAGYKGDFQGSVRTTGMFYSSSSSGGFGVEWSGKIGWRNAGQGWREVIEGNGQEWKIYDVLRAGSPISNIQGMRISFGTDNSVSMSNIYNASVLNLLTVGYSSFAGFPASSGGTITSGRHTAGATDMPGSNLTITGGGGTGNNATNGDIIFQTPDVNVSGTAAQTYTNKMRIYRNGTVVIGTSSPVSSAVFEIQSITRGVVLCKMTTAQRDAISTPVEGLEIYNISTHKKQVFDGTIWQDCW